MAENLIDKYDVIVIGKGPAGIQAALCAQDAGFATLVIGKGNSALADVESLANYYGFEDPISGADLLAAGLAQAKRHGIDLLEDEVTGAATVTDGFRVKTATADYSADALIIAVGMTRKKSSLEGVAGITGRDLKRFTVRSASLHRGKDVAVLGTDTFALQEARELTDHSASVTILTNTKTPQIDFDEYDLPVCADRIVDLRKDDLGSLTGIVFEGGKTLPVEDLVIAEGKATAIDLAVKLGVDPQDNGIKVDEAMRTGVPGVYVAGDCSGGKSQVAVAVGRGATAGLEAAKWLRARRGDKPEKAQRS